MTNIVANTNLVVACNILDRVSTMLHRKSRVQLSINDLKDICNYIAKAMKYIDSDIKAVSSQVLTFGACISAIDEFVAEKDSMAISMQEKDSIVNRIYSGIVEFKVNTGIYLTTNEFDYKSNMDTVLRSIVDTCIENGYYFGY